MRSAPVSLPKLLRARYPSVDAERAALETWAFSQTHLYHARELGRLAAIGIPKEPVWTYAASVVLLLSLLTLDSLPQKAGGGLVILLPATIGWVLGGRTIPKLARYLLYPHARRAALWLGWLGNKAALPYLLRAWRKHPRTERHKTWTMEVETALTDLLDVLPPGSDIEGARDGLETLVGACWRACDTSNGTDFTLSRTYLLVAALRFLYAAPDGGDAALLGRIASAWADPVRTPNRCLVRDVAQMYRDAPAANNTAPAMPAAASVGLPIAALTLLQRP